MKKEIISFDCETTGPNPMKDRIIQFGYVIYSVESKSIIESSKLLIKPEGEYNIDPQAEAIHNISREIIESSGVTLRSIADKIKSLFENRIILTFNGSRFDVCLLEREFERIGVDLYIFNNTFIDALDIERYFNSNTLENTYKRYYNEDLTNVTNYEATLKILLAQLKNHDKIEISNIIDKTTESTKISPEGFCSLIEGDLVFNIGKYKSRNTSEICKIDPSYIGWLFSSDIITKNTKESIKKYYADTLSK